MHHQVGHIAVSGALILATAVACGSTATEHEADLSTATQGIRDVAALIEAGDGEQARLAFLEVHEPMHATADRVSSVDPEVSEVVNDITEVLKLRFTEDADPETLTELSYTALRILDQARYALE